MMIYLRDPTALSFLDEMSGIVTAARLSLDTVRAEIVTFRNHLNKMISISDASTTAQTLKNYLATFLKVR